MSEAILVGGSRDGFVTESVSGMKSVNNISLNDDFTEPEHVDLYIPTNLTDKEGREIFVHVGRYDGEESKSYWEAMEPEEREALVATAKKEKEEEAAALEAAEAEKAAKAEQESTSAAAIAAAVTAAIEAAKKAPAEEVQPAKTEEATEPVAEVTPEPEASEEKAE